MAAEAEAAAVVKAATEVEIGVVLWEEAMVVMAVAPAASAMVATALGAPWVHGLNPTKLLPRFFGTLGGARGLSYQLWPTMHADVLFHNGRLASFDADCPGKKSPPMTSWLDTILEH